MITINLFSTLFVSDITTEHTLYFYFIFTLVSYKWRCKVLEWMLREGVKNIVSGSESKFAF